MRLLRSFQLLLLHGVVALKAAPLWAEEINKAAEKAGLPQLDATFFPSQIFWLGITFAILYVLMRFVALPGVEHVQQKRPVVIAAELAAANSANESARHVIAEYEKALADARTQAIAAEDMSHAAKKSLDSQAEQHNELTRRVHQAEVRIGVADAALHEVQTAAAELAGIYMEKITGMKLQVKS